MVASNAISGHGTLFRKSNAAYPSVAAFTTIAEVKAINGLGVRRDFGEVTHMQSGGWKEHIPLNAEAKPVTIDVNFVPTDDTLDFTVGAGKDLVDKVKRYYQVVFPDNTTWQLAGYVEDVSANITQNDPLGATITFRMTEQPTMV